MTLRARTDRPSRSPAAGPACVAVLMLAGGLAAGGCGTAGEQVYGGFRVGSPEALAPAEQNGQYEVKWAASAGGRLTVVPGARRYVAGGTRIGFATEPATGRPVAVAGAERIPLDKLPPEARHLAWAVPRPAAPTRVARAVFVAPLAAVAGWWGGLGDGGGDSDNNDGGGSGSSSDDCDPYGPSYTAASYHERNDRDGGGGGGSSRPESDRGYVPWASEPKAGR